jgi:hypothetical protein
MSMDELPWQQREDEKETQRWEEEKREKQAREDDKETKNWEQDKRKES